MSTARAVVFKGFVDIAVRAGGLLTFSVLARYAGPDGYGAYSQVNTVVGLMIPFAALGLSQALVRFFAKRGWTPATRADFMRVIGVVALGASIAGLVVSFSAPQLNDLILKWPEGEMLFRWGGGLVLAGALVQLQLDFLRARMRLILFCLVQLVDALLLVAATVLLLPAGFSLIVLIQVVFAARLVLFVVVMLGYWSWDRPRLHTDISTPLPIGRMIAFGMPLAVSAFGLWMMYLVDRLVIGYYLSAAELGLYAAASTFAGMIAAANAPLMLPLLPRLMQALGDEVRVMAEMRLFHRYIALTMVPAAAFLIAIIPPLLIFIGGAPFSAPSGLIALLVLALVFQQWNSLAPYYLMCRDRVVFMQNAWLLMGVLNLLGNLFAVPHFGLIGSAIVTFATFSVLDAAFFLYAQRLINLKSCYQFALSLKAAAASAIAYLAAVLVLRDMGPTAAGLVLASALFLTIYLIIMRALGEIGTTELKLLSKVFFPNRST